MMVGWLDSCLVNYVCLLIRLFLHLLFQTHSKMGGDLGKDFPMDIKDLKKESKYTTSELKRWYQNFKKMYPEGYIDKLRFKNLYCKTYPAGDASSMADQVFRVFDENRDGKVDFREIVIGLGVGSRGTVVEKMNLMFSLYDINGDGYIKRDEMLVIVKSMVKMISHNASSSVGCFGEFQTSKYEAKARKQVDEMFKEMDINDDGLISLEEFLALGKRDSPIMQVLGLAGN